jgi:hypothetical protein
MNFDGYPFPANVALKDASSFQGVQLLLCSVSM